MTDPYVYPGTDVLRNKFNIVDAADLAFMERRLARNRMADGVPTGDFDLPHLQAIHRHLFQDIYDWAGEVRTCPLTKNGDAFQHPRHIHAGMADVSRRLEKADYLKGLSPWEFAAKAGEIVGDVNYVHPFREGNGRTQLLFLDQLAGQAGHPLQLWNLDPGLWVEASKAAHRGDYAPMSHHISNVMAPVELSPQQDSSLTLSPAIAPPENEPEL